MAANATLQSPADGYTFLVDAANQVTNPRLMANLPFGRAAEPAEVAALAVMLSSSRVSYVSGTTLDIDGGISFR